MMSLPEFLLACLDEDEAAARREMGRFDVVLLGAFSPARVLADVEAKRRIVEEHEMMPARKITVGVLRFNDGREVSPYYRDGCCQTCTAWGEYGGPADAETGALNYCPTLRLLALPYADHPDYRAEWKP